MLPLAGVYVAAGEITPMPKCAIFADTQDEPQSVYTWLDWLEKQLPFPVHRVTRGKLSERCLETSFSKKNQCVSFSSIPAFLKTEAGTVSLIPRQCTRDFKIHVKHAPFARESFDRKLVCDPAQLGIRCCDRSSENLASLFPSDIPT